MTVVIASKNDYTGTVAPNYLNTETTVVEIPGATDDYIVEGYLDVSALQSGDVVTVREYIAVDGTNYQLFAETQIVGPAPLPVLRFHSKTFNASMLYKVTIEQTAGTLRTFPYGFVQLILGTG